MDRCAFSLVIRKDALVDCDEFSCQSPPFPSIKLKSYFPSDCPTWSAWDILDCWHNAGPRDDDRGRVGGGRDKSDTVG